MKDFVVVKDFVGVNAVYVVGSLVQAGIVLGRRCLTISLSDLARPLCRLEEKNTICLCVASGGIENLTSDRHSQRACSFGV